MRLHLFTFFGFAALALTSACEGGQTGDLSGEDPGNGGLESGSNCEEHKEKLAGFDTDTEQGTAEDVMAYAEKSFEAPLTWKDPAEGQSWSVGPESGQGVIHLDVARGAHAYRLTYTPKANDSGLELGSICPPPQLGVDVHVDVTTDGGALAESYDTLLRTSTTGVSTLSLPLDFAKLKGDLAASYSQPRTQLVQTSIDATLTAQGFTGSISGMEQVDSGSGNSGVSSAMGAQLAVWPGSEACSTLSPDGTGLTTPLEQEALGSTGAATLASITPTTPVDIKWMNDASTKLTVGIVSTGDGCFTVRDDLPLELDGGPTLSYPVTITLKSDDGRLDGSYSGAVVVTNAERRRVNGSATLELAVTELSKSGFTGVKVPDGVDTLRLQVDSKWIDGVASGSVHLFAVSNAPCATEPAPMSGPGSGSSAPGCAGQSVAQLETASWTD